MTAPGSGKKRRYRDARWRLLVDLHIGDWDKGFLAKFDPKSIAAAAEYIGAEAVMLYFQSHLGLCYYPTKVGVRHRVAADRDLAGESVAALADIGQPVCAYYSVNFNNAAWNQHPDWRLQPAAPATMGVLPRERYGIVCLNNPEYREFVNAQVDEITTYPIDAFFFDMMWWNGVCVCPSCRSRYRAEAGAEIPETIDWSSPRWVDFQLARERWLTAFALDLRTRVRQRLPEADVYHNFALGLSNWTRGVGVSSVAGHDFLGGDYYGGPAEQLLVTRLMRNLTPNRPAEFMTTAAAGLIEHTRLRPTSLLQTKALAALSSDAAFLAIVAMDPDGTLDPESLDRVRAGFAAGHAYEAFAGGDAIEEIGVYFSDNSRINFGLNGRSITSEPAISAPDYPHYEALSGACRILQRAHLQFGVLTSANLHELDRWPVLVLPNLQRMTAEEVSAIRDYVRNGGRIYASRDTSLAGMSGGHAEDFLLADVFGAHAEGEELGRLVYARSVAWPEPRRPLTHWRSPLGKVGARRLRAGEGETLAALTLPYGYPHLGTAADTNWASIHSSPPWEDTEAPVIVRNAFGKGIAIYSAFDIEAGATPEHDALFLSLMRALLPAPRIEIETHPNVWASAFTRGDTVGVSLLNYQLDDPRLPIPAARVRMRVEPGRRWVEVRRAPELTRVPHTEPSPGVIEFDTGSFDLFAQHLVEFAVADNSL